MESAFALALTAGIKGVAMVMDQEAQPLTSDPTRGRVIIISNHSFNCFFVSVCSDFMYGCYCLCFCFFSYLFVSSFRFSVSSFVCFSAAPLLCFLYFNCFLFLCFSAR